MATILRLALPATLLMTNALLAGEPLKSGPAAGKNLPGVFHPVTIHCPAKPDVVGKRWCWVEAYGARPVVMIFVRTPSEPTAMLVKKVDEKLAQNKAVELRGLVVWLSEDNEESLKSFGKQHALKLTMATERAKGPSGYAIAPEAEASVILYTRRQVVANHAYRKGELTAKTIQGLLDDIDQLIATNPPAEEKASEAALVAGLKPLKSAPAAGKNVPGPFHPLTVHCPEDPIFVGRRVDYIEDGYGPKPTILAFARGMSEPLMSLIQALDAKLTEPRAQEVRGLVVWLSTFDGDLRQNLKTFAEKQKIGQLTFAIYDVAGPNHYEIAKEAELSLMLTVKRRVVVNHAYRHGELTAKAAQRVLDDLDQFIAKNGAGETKAARQAPLPAAGGAAPLNAERIAAAAGSKATTTPDGVVRLSWPRNDVKVAVDGVPYPPFAGLGSWAAFTSAPRGAMVMGDTVVFQDEVTPAMDAAFANGLEVTGLHNHFFFDEPKVYFMHIGGVGAPEQLAHGVKEVWDAIKKVRAGQPAPGTRFPGKAPAAGKIDAAPLDQVLGTKGQSQDGVVKYTINRDGMMHGVKVGGSMGLTTWAAFTGRDELAVVAGDFIMTAQEVQPLLRSLRKGNLHVVALHNHMIGEEPVYYFVHFWGKGPTRELASALKAALDVQRDVSMKAKRH